ncbi:PP2C family protein-serine/threonine phosphatase [Teredinibacter sp. KSP-S5-2]|uniref:PP2C family protein-serine/threonine phosphatase n=1 Tax=Teredinibacter sp. KSP-S5-2 TaxID=3034506 RepID=UPI0029344304|nr:protein phosphatase 2C domain-containing protein [Teredinibacter sp. KSP-S5-2]WNO11209.1 protein phosphatase 2C domain-containing protein [Teredinibacter sp. KSP-S5-2]
MLFSGHQSETNVGLLRTNNEDCFLASPKLGLWLVADGMGGHAAGEVASDIAAKTVHNKLREGASLVEAIQAAHQGILHASSMGIGGQGMGSTVVALHSEETRYEIAWVGDSRAYLFTKHGPDEESEFQQLTRDHSYVQFLYESGAISQNEMEDHPEKNIITQCLGSLDMDRVNVDLLQRDWRKNDLVLLCSDGLTDKVDSDTIKSILDSSKSLPEMSKRLVTAALEKGGHDNITVQLIAPPSPWLRLLQRASRKAYQAFSNRKPV